MRIPWLLYLILTGVFGSFVAAALLAREGILWPIITLSIAWSMGYLVVNHFRTTIQRGQQRQKERDEP